MFRLITTASELVCNHGGKVTPGPGSEAFKIGELNALRVRDVLQQPVVCDKCKRVTAVTKGYEPKLRQGSSPAPLTSDDGSPLLTEIAGGTTDAGMWWVAVPAAGAARVAPGVDPPSGPAPDETPAPPPDDTHPERDISRPLVVSARRAYRAPDPDTLQFDPAPQDEYGVGVSATVAAGGWLYVFDAAGRRPTFRREYRVAAEGRVEEVKGGFRAKGTVGPPPPLAPPAWLRVPLGKGGAARKYLFLLSPVRLTERAAGRWAGRAGAAVVTVGPATRAAEATDPLRVAEWLGRVYEGRCDRLVERATWLGPGLHASHEPARGLLARLLVPLLDNPALDLKDDLKADGESLRAFNQEHEEKVRKLTAGAEHAGEQLTRWLRSGLWREVEAAYDEFRAPGYPGDDYHHLLRAYGRCTTRLPESAAGRSYLDRLAAAERGHFLWDAATRSKPVPEGVFKAVKKSPDVLAKLWGGVAYFLGHPKVGVKVAEYTLALHLYLRVPGEPKVLFPFTHPVRLGPSRPLIPLVDPAAAADKLAATLTWLTDPAVRSRFVDHAKTALSVANLAVALDKLRRENKAENWATLVGAASEVVEKGLTSAGHKAPGWLGRVTAVCTMFTAASDAHQGVAHNDPGLVIGSGMIIVGTLIGLNAAELGALGVAGLSASWWTVVGAVVVGAGYLIAVLASKQDAERFALHCEWGKYYPPLPKYPAWAIADKYDRLPAASWEHAGTGRLKWAEHTYNEWENRPDRQLAALLRLVAGFRVTVAGRTAVRIDPGLTFPGSRFEVVIRLPDGMGDERYPGFSIDPAGGPPASLPGWDATIPASVSRNSERGLTVTPGPLPPGLAVTDGWRYQGFTCWVRLDVFGNGALLIPGAKSWVELVCEPTGLPAYSTLHREYVPPAATSTAVDCLAAGPAPRRT